MNLKLKNTNQQLCPLVKALLVVFLVFGFTQNVMSQAISVDEAATNQEVRDFVEDVLLGSCVTVSNITYAGPADASGTFDGAGTILGLDGGIILTTGQGSIAEGPDDDDNAGNNQNNGGDPDLNILAGLNTFDAVILEFDFVPQNADLRFNYIFGSEEYPEYVNAGFNDVFGFFISGPGITGPFTSPAGFPGGAQNIALIPGTSTPVAIDNVNNGQSGSEPATGPCTNCAYYVDNSGGSALQYDGYTTVLTAEATVTPCLTYHIKLAVGDAGDGIFDSGVFLEEESFSAGGGGTVDIHALTAPTGVYEGCDDAWFIFNRVDLSDNSVPLTVGFTISGTATPVADYAAFPNTITIPAGEDSVFINLGVVLDFIPEGSETIIVTMDDAPCFCLAPASAEVIILDNDIPLAVATTGTTTICLGQSTDITANPTGSQTPHTGGWDNGLPAGDNQTVTPTTTTTYTYTVTDNCGGQTVSSSETVTVIRPDFTIDDDEQCFDGNSFSFLNTAASGGTVTHFWDFGDSNTSTNESPTHSYASDGSYTVTHNVIYTASSCTSDASAMITVFDEPILTVTVDQDVICDGGTDGAISTSITGGTAAFNYVWTPGGATTSGISGLSVGAYSVVVTDANGCTGNGSETISQNDPIPPTAVCQDITVQLNASGAVTISASQVDNGSSDNCGIASMVVSPNAFGCIEIGGNAVTLTVTDINGNVSTCNATVTVEDNINPTAVCQNITVQLDASGNASIVAADVDGGSTDNCSVSIAATPLAFTCANVGSNTVVLMATDGSGNTDNCNATVTVEDTTSPIAVCQDITIQLDSLGNASIDPTEIDNGSNDACGILDFSVDVSTFNCATVASNTVVLTVEDNNGNISTCTAEVLVEDNVAPNAVCQDATLYLDSIGQVFIASTNVDGGSTDNCVVNTVFLAQNNFSCADLGTNIIELTVVDVNGNSDNCSAEITVLDTLNPVIIACPTDTVIVPDSSNCSPQVFWIEPTTEDNCTPTLTSDFISGDNFSVGTTTVTYTSTDQSGNSISCSFNIAIEPTPVLVSITPQQGPCGYNLSCNAAADGQATANPAGGCLTYTYLWSDPLAQTTQTATGLNAGTYAVTVTDANGTTATETIVVTEPDVLATDSITSPEFNGGANISCNGGFDGAVNINVIGGSECIAYDFAWTGPNGFTSTSQDLAGLDAGTYVVTVSDASGCSYMDSITLIEQGLLDVDSLVSDYNGVNVSCGGAADGSIDLTVSGGTTPYTYVWNNGETTEDIDSLVAGIYAYTVTDANGCQTSSGSFTLIEPDGLSSFNTTSDYNGFNVSCFGLSDGSIDLSVNDGIAPYTYVWSNGEITQDIDTLSAGPYTVVIADANGCTLQDSVMMSEPDDIVINPTDTTIISCNAAEDGAFTVEAVGGVPTFTYAWSHGQTGPAAQDLGSGTYTVTATDGNGCADSLQIVMTEPDTIQLLQALTTNATCFGGNDGDATVIVEGGTEPYTYNWPSISQSGNTAINLEAGEYVFLVSDANSCVYTDTVQVAEPDEVIVTVTSDTAVCSGNSVTITASATGGAGNYSYSWDNGLGFGATHFVIPAVATTYSVEVFDQSGCAASIASVTVDIAQLPVADFTSAADVPCVFPATIIYTNTSTGAIGFEWLLGNGDLSSDENPITIYDVSGSYTVTLIATSGAGCSDTTTQVVNIDDLPMADFTIDNAQGCAPLSVNFGNDSGTGLEYMWDFGDGTTSSAPNPTHWYEIPGDYEVTLIVSAIGGCSDTLGLGAAVSVYSSPIADFTLQQIIFPEPGSEFEFINNTTGADLYNWDFGNGEQTDEYQPTYLYPTYGGYFVTLTAINEFGCADTAVHYLNVDLNTHLFVPNAIGIGQPDEAGVFLPKGTGIEDYHVWIFDKWGSLIWESTAVINGSPAEGWDGVYKGQTVPQGSYVWKIDATFLDGEIWEGQEHSNSSTSSTGSVMVLY